MLVERGNFINAQYNRFTTKRASFVNRISKKFEQLDNIFLTAQVPLYLICFSFFHNLSKFFIFDQKWRIIPHPFLLGDFITITLDSNFRSIEYSLSQISILLKNHYHLLPIIYVTLGNQMVHFDTFKRVCNTSLEHFTTIEADFKQHFLSFLFAIVEPFSHLGYNSPLMSFESRE
jgi:hypothetical protein